MMCNMLREKKRKRKRPGERTTTCRGTLKKHGVHSKTTQDLNKSERQRRDTMKDSNGNVRSRGGASSPARNGGGRDRRGEKERKVKRAKPIEGGQRLSRYGKPLSGKYQQVRGKGRNHKITPRGTPQAMGGSRRRRHCLETSKSDTIGMTNAVPGRGRHIWQKGEGRIDSRGAFRRRNAC